MRSSRRKRSSNGMPSCGMRFQTSPLEHRKPCLSHALHSRNKTTAACLRRIGSEGPFRGLGQKAWQHSRLFPANHPRCRAGNGGPARYRLILGVRNRSSSCLPAVGIHNACNHTRVHRTLAKNGIHRLTRCVEISFGNCALLRGRGSPRRRSFGPGFLNRVLHQAIQSAHAILPSDFLSFFISASPVPDPHLSAGWSAQAVNDLGLGESRYPLGPCSPHGPRFHRDH
jgi:hypothetical protein